MVSKIEEPKNFERLFLLEFLVDHVIIYNSKLQLDENATSLGPVIVRFQFLTYPPIEIREEDFTPSTKPLVEEKRILLKSGRSCMFSLGLNKSTKICETDFDVFISILRTKFGTAKGKLGAGETDDNIYIGGTSINMNDSMKDLICKSGGSKANEKMTHTKTAGQNFFDKNGNLVGKIVFLIRVSCFGYMIVTGFQLSEEDKRNFKYKNISEVPSSDKRGPKDSSGKDIPKKDEDKKGDKKGGKKADKKDKKPKKDPKSSGDKLKPPGGTGRCVCPFGFPKTPVCTCCPCQRTDASIKSPMPFNITSPGQTSYRGYGSLQGQGVQAFPSLTSSSPVTGQSKTKDIDMDPGSVAIRGNQLVFKMPDKTTTEQVPVEGKFASSVYYTMGDDKKEGPRNVIQILPQNPPPVTGDEKGGQFDKQDVLVLKLGKKRLAAGKKPKLELELRTPKMKPQKPETDTQYTQYLESDIPKAKKKPTSAKSSKKGSRKGKKPTSAKSSKKGKGKKK